MTSSRRLFLKQVGLGAGTYLLGKSPFTWAAEARGLPRSTPAAEGVLPEKILAFLDAIAASKHELHSLMIVRHGKVIAEGWWAPYGPQFRHTMYSMSKSFTSTAVGFAVSEGKLRVDDKVMSFFPKSLPDPVSENLAALKVQHLLTMSVGNEKEPTGVVVKSEDWVRTFLAQPITHEPGSVFMYNSAATYMCSAIVQQVTGQKVVDYLQPRLFEPLGIRDVTWETCPRGINTGGWGLSIQTEGLAKFGQLYLQKGKWQGREILPAKWVEEATRFHIQQPAPAKPTRAAAENDWMQGYGYQFWRCRHDAFRGDGAFGQYTIVLPEQEAVIAMTGESSNMQGELDLIWEHLLPAIQAAPVTVDAEVQGRLEQRLRSLALPPPKGESSSPAAARITGKTIQLEPNDLGFRTVRLVLQGEDIGFHAADEHREHVIRLGLGSWRYGSASLPGTPPRLISGGAPAPGTPSKIAASGTWKDENTFEMTWRYYETPHHDTVTCAFTGDAVKITFLSSIAQMSGRPQDARPSLQGRISG